MSELASEAVSCLRDLIAQIEAGKLRDELGHDFRLNDAFVRATALIEQIEAENCGAVHRSR
jgi:hypothetical protein